MATACPANRARSARASRRRLQQRREPLGLQLRFEEVVRGAELERLAHPGELVVRGEDDHLRQGTPFPQPTQQLQPVHPGHDEVEDDEGGLGCS
jgi:hypothetical protein